MKPVTGELADLASAVVGRAGSGEQVEAFVARSRSLTVRVAGGDVESLSMAEPAGVGIRVITGGRQGFAHCGTLDPTVVMQTLDEARHNAGFAEPDPHAGLAEPDGVSVVEAPFDPSVVERLSVDDKVALAVELERRVTGADPRVQRVRTAMYGDSVGEVAIATSTGIVAMDRGADAYISVAALAADDTGTTVGGATDASRDPESLDLDGVATDAVARAVRMLGAAPVPSTRLSAVFEPRLAATVVGLLVGALNGERVVKGRSPFSDRVGELVASPLLGVVDDATDPRSLAAASVDGEGLASRRTVLVANGVLQGFLHNTWTARRLGTTTTASAARGYRSTPGVGSGAVAMMAGTGTLDELVGGIDHGLLVASLTGLHSGVNPVSGDVSVGVEGILIRNGELTQPVREVTLASTLQRILGDISAVGSDLQWLPGGTAASTIVVDGMALGGS